MITLYELQEKYRYLLENSITEDGEISEENIRQLDSLQNDIDVKAENVAHFIKNIEATENAVKEAIEKLELRKKRLSDKRVWLSDYLLNCLLAAGKERVTTSMYFDKIAIQDNPPSVFISNIDDVPQKYKKEKHIITISVDKAEIKKAIENKEEVAGAYLEQKKRLIIK
jgi:cell division ATPase FtsA